MTTDYGTEAERALLDGKTFSREEAITLCTAQLAALNVPLQPTDTIPELADRAAQRGRWEKRLKIAQAKTNVDRLMAQGVIVSCDDEMVSSYRYDHVGKLAAEYGMTHADAEALFYKVRDQWKVIDELRAAVFNRETNAEHAARVEAALASATGTMPSGKPCKHNATKKERGWFTYDHEHWVCGRCGTRVEVLPRPKENGWTEQALVAWDILEGPGLLMSEKTLRSLPSLEARYPGFTEAEVFAAARAARRGE